MRRDRSIPVRALASNAGWLILALAVFVPCEVAVVTMLRYMGAAFDVPLHGGEIDEQRAELIALCLRFALLLITIFALNLLHKTVYNRYIAGVCTYTRKAYMQGVLDLEMNRFARRDGAYYQSKLINDIKRLEDCFYAPIAEIFKRAVAFIVAVVFIAGYDFRLVLFVIVVSVLPIFLPKLFEKKIDARMRQFSRSAEAFTQSANETLEGYDVFRNNNARAEALERFCKKDRQFSRQKNRAFRLQRIAGNAVVFSSYLTGISILVFSMVLAANGDMTVGDIFAVFFISSGVSEPITDFMESIPKLIAGRAFAEQFVFEQARGEKAPVEPELGRIEVDGLTLRVSGKAILEGFSTVFARGKKYLIVGESGAGKSSLVKALLGYNPDFDGEIRYDGTPIGQIDLAKLYAKIAYLPQTPHFFQGTLRDNLTMFDDGITTETLAEVLRTVNLYDKLAALGGGDVEAGLSATLQERAANLSGGEKQRLALARELLKGPELMILDEATSAVDRTNAVEIEARLLSRPCTLIVITHQVREELRERYDEMIEIR